jgi:hypothetical protein
VLPIDAGRCRVRLELHVTPTGLNRLFAPMLKKVLDGRCGSGRSP